MILLVIFTDFYWALIRRVTKILGHNPIKAKTVGPEDGEGQKLIGSFSVK